MIDGHGDDIRNHPGIEINFSSNINPFRVNPGLAGYLKNCMNRIDSYPEPLAESLAQQIGDSQNLPGTSVLVTNGAVEALYLIASLLIRKHSLIYIPSFAEYEDACKAFGHTIEYRENKYFSGKESLNGFDAVWIGNPNNPDGKLYDTEKLKELIVKNPDIFFVIDEAYRDFIPYSSSLVEYASVWRNIAVIHSLTKRYAIPGIRLGYLVSHPGIIKKIKQTLMPWRINSLAIEAGMFCLSKRYKDKFNVNELVRESKRVQAAISNLKNFEVQPSGTIFFLTTGPVKAFYLKQHLAEKHRLLIRDASNFRGLSEYHFRVSIRTPEENEKLINALREWD